MDIFQIARDHYTQKRVNPLGNFELPEWADSDGVVPKVYVRSMNLAEESERTRYALDKDLLNFNIFTIVFCACDEEMKPIFKRNDAKFLANNMCASVLNRIVAEINKVIEENSMGELDGEKKS